MPLPFASFATPWTALVPFYADVLVVLFASWQLVCATAHERHGCLEAILAWFWAAIALVTASGIILGAVGGFGPRGFLAVHLVALFGLLAWRRRALSADREAWLELHRRFRRFCLAPGPDRWLALGLFSVLAGLTVIGAWAQPAAMDALTYHLPRLGHWLQEGRIEMIATNDERMNFVAAGPEIVTAWLVGGVQTGFQLSVLAQALGGVMTVGATIALGRESGLTRTAALLAGFLLLGMANLVAQFTTAQTDLFTTGVFAVSFHLWLAGLRRRQVSLPGALGAGLAVGAKGTLFYLGPGALLWLVWLAWRHRAPWAYWWRTLLVGAVGLGLFTLPGLVRNRLAYGNALGPVAWVEKHHQGFDSIGGQWEKLTLNLKSSLIQSLEPHSQPLGLRTLAHSAGQKLWQGLPAQDPYTLPGINRREILAQVLSLSSPDADVASFGVVLPALFLLASAWALVSRQAAAPLIRTWSAGIAIFVLFFHVMQQWHPYAFRYLVLAAPWIAITAAWGIEQSGVRWRRPLWLLLVLLTVSVGWRITSEVRQGGWKSAVHPERLLGSFVAQSWREWSESLDESPSAGFIIALPAEMPVTAFYRQARPRRVRYERTLSAQTAGEFLQGRADWLIVPAARFLGQEGRVAARVWLFAGQENHVYSLAAYRALAPGEQPQPIVYRNRPVAGTGSPGQELLVKTFDAGTLRLVLDNHAGSDRGYSWATPSGSGRGRLKAGEYLTTNIPVPPNVVTEIRVGFEPGAETGSPAPTVQILP